MAARGPRERASTHICSCVLSKRPRAAALDVRCPFRFYLLHGARGRSTLWVRSGGGVAVYESFFWRKRLVLFKWYQINNWSRDC
jgi:hypothetical protein